MLLEQIDLKNPTISEILDRFDYEDIDYQIDNYTITFDKLIDFEDALEIIEDIVGPFGYESYYDQRKIILLPKQDELNQIDTYSHLIKEDYLTKKIDKETYFENLNFVKNYLEDFKKDDIDLNEDVDLREDILIETYSDEELEGFINKVFNQQKILNIYHRKKYGQDCLFAHTRCINCGREKKVFLSNLVTNPDKFGSCLCSNVNIDARMNNIEDLYKGKKKLSTNTSGYTGVYFVGKYKGQVYNKWRAYIEINGKRNYLGDFNSKSKAIRARKLAAAKGLKWYKDNKNKFMSNFRKKQKRYKTKRIKKNN